MSQKKTKAIIFPHWKDSVSQQIIRKILFDIEVPPVVLLITTHHEISEKKFSIMKKGALEREGSTFEIHQKSAEHLMMYFPWFRENELISTLEPTFQLPLQILHRYLPSIQIVPIIVPDAPYEKCMALGEALTKTLLNQTNTTLLIVLTHFSHELNRNIRMQQDKKILEAINTFSVKSFYDIVTKEKIKTCSLTPVTALLQMLSNVGASRIEHFSESTSTLIDHHALIFS